MHLALAHLRQLRLRGGRYLRDGKNHDFDAVSGQLREGSNLRCGFVAQQESPAAPLRSLILNQEKYAF